MTGIGSNSIEIGALGKTDATKANASDIAVIMNDVNADDINMNRLRSNSDTNDNEDLYDSQINYKNADIEGTTKENGTNRITASKAETIDASNTLDKLEFGGENESENENEMNTNENVTSASDETETACAQIKRTERK